MGCEAQQIRVLLLESNGMTSVPGTHVMVDREDRPQLTPDLHMEAVPSVSAHTLHTHTDSRTFI